MSRVQTLVGALVVLACFATRPASIAAAQGNAKQAHDHKHVEFSMRLVRNGLWSDAKIRLPARVPETGDRVLVSRGTQVEYDVDSEAVLRLVQVVGTLRFSRDRDTQLDVGVLNVQNSDVCSESGFACDFDGVSPGGEPQKARTGKMPTLEIGTLDGPCRRSPFA